MNEAQIIDAISRLEGVLDVTYARGPNGMRESVKLIDGRTLVQLNVYIETPVQDENVLGVHVRETIKSKDVFGGKR